MENKKYFVVGIDVGGTNTGKQLFFNILNLFLDAAILEYPSKKIISCTKTFTTKDISTGVFNAIRKVISK